MSREPIAIPNSTSGDLSMLKMIEEIEPLGLVRRIEPIEGVPAFMLTVSGMTAFVTLAALVAVDAHSLETPEGKALEAACADLPEKLRRALPQMSEGPEDPKIPGIE